MKTKYITFIAVFVISLASIALMHQSIQALVLEDVQYPVEELEGCENETDCRNYCSEPDNADRCLDFAVKEGLMSSQEVDIARKFLKGEIKGPGGCTNKEQCENYCNDISRVDECISFVEENNLLPPSELQEFKQVQAAIKRGVKPPACKNRESCELYCEESEHMEECINFGVEAGFLNGQEKEDAQKMLQAIQRGVKLPPCRGRAQCEEFCSQPDNMEQCMTFAMEAGFMSDEERGNSQKMLDALKKGVKPLGCKGKEACEDYCSEEQHFEECFTFAEAAGFVTAEEAEMARKAGGKSPGNCRGRQECEAFCQNPTNQEVCMNFAREHGMLSEKDAGMMEEGRRSEDSMPVPPEGFQGCNSKEECEKFMMPREEGARQEMMGQQSGEYLRPDTQTIPEEYKQQYDRQSRQQYDQQPQSMEQEQQYQEQQQYQEPLRQEEIKQPEPTGFRFGSGHLLGALVYTFFDLLFGR